MTKFHVHPLHIRADFSKGKIYTSSALKKNSLRQCFFAEGKLNPLNCNIVPFQRCDETIYHFDNWIYWGSPKRVGVSGIFMRSSGCGSADIGAAASTASAAKQPRNWGFRQLDHICKKNFKLIPFKVSTFHYCMMRYYDKGI